MTVLGIESSCDETAAAVVVDGKTLLSNVVFSSMDLHKVYGGVVPEIAARSHIESIIPVIEEALRVAFARGEVKSNEQRAMSDEGIGMQELSHESRTSSLTAHRSLLTSADLWDKIDAIAVTYGAGLGGSLLVGVMTAKTLAIMKKKPLYAINHVEAHVYANFLTEVKVSNEQGAKSNGGKSGDSYSANDERRTTNDDHLQLDNQTSKIDSHRSPFTVHRSQYPYSNWELDGVKYTLPKKQPDFPMLALIVSGGHSQLALFQGHFDYVLLGQTRDDAIGEAFDKVAKIIGLPYPGGPSISKAAKLGDPYKYKLPKARLEGTNPALDNLRASITAYHSPLTAHDPRIVDLDAMQGANEEAKQGAHVSATRANRSSVTQKIAKFNNSSYEFSFSGLKTAVLRLAQSEVGEDYTFPSFKLADRLSEAQKNDIAASFERVAIETVVDKTILAIQEFQPMSIVIAGGVAASPELRRQLSERLHEETVSNEHGAMSSFKSNDERRTTNDENQTSYIEPQPSPFTVHRSPFTSPISPTLLFPDIKLCTDNGAMIATLGCFKAMLGASPVDPNTLAIEPNLSM